MRDTGETGAENNHGDFPHGAFVKTYLSIKRRRVDRFLWSHNFSFYTFSQNFINGKSIKVSRYVFLLNFGNSRLNLESFPDSWCSDPGLRALSRGRHQGPRAPRRRTRWALESIRTRSELDCGDMNLMFNSGARKSRYLYHNLRDRDGGRHCDHHQDLPLRQGDISISVLHTGGNRSHDK